MTWKYLRRYLDANGITYAQYLASDHWVEFRRKVWASSYHKQCCFACGTTKRVEVHHISYKRIGKERLTDVALLCRDCHQAAHDNQKVARSPSLWGSARRIKKNLERFGQRLVRRLKPA